MTNCVSAPGGQPRNAMTEQKSIMTNANAIKVAIFGVVAKCFNDVTNVSRDSLDLRSLKTRSP